MSKFGTIAGTVLGLAVLAGGVAMAVPESRNLILDEVAKSSNAYKTQVKENDKLRLEISELKTDIANKQSEVTTLTEQKVVLLNTVTKIDNEINTTTDATTLDNLQERKTAILNQIDDLNSQIASKQSEIERLQARVEELENSVQINVTNVGKIEYYAGLMTDELANLLENATDEELHNYLSDSNIVWNNVFSVGNNSNFENLQERNFSFGLLKNLHGYVIEQSIGREVGFNCDYGSFNGYERISAHGYFYSDDNYATFKRELTSIDLNLTYKLADGTIIDINNYDDNTLLTSYRCQNINATYDENNLITSLTGDIVILSMEEARPEIVEEQTATLISGSELKTAIGTEVTAVTFDHYTDSENQTYVVDGVNVIEGISPVSVTTSDSEGSANLYMVDNKAYILSKDKIVANDDMSNAFMGCSVLKSINLNNLDTSNVTNMMCMFSDCRQLESLDVTKFNTSKVTNMLAMFSQCMSLKSLDLSNFDTSKVTNMNAMFCDCSGLTDLDLSSFDTSNVVSMDGMFANLTLTTLDLSNFDTNKVTSMDQTFINCVNLTTLDLSSFDTGSVVNMNCMFYGCNSLTTIYVGDNWNVDNVTSSGSMFNGCANLPNFDENAVDKTNAYIGGYLTSKTQNAETEVEEQPELPFV